MIYSRNQNIQFRSFQKYLYISLEISSTHNLSTITKVQIAKEGWRSPDRSDMHHYLQRKNYTTSKMMHLNQMNFTSDLKERGNKNKGRKKMPWKLVTDRIFHPLKPQSCWSLIFFTVFLSYAVSFLYLAFSPISHFFFFFFFGLITIRSKKVLQCFSLQYFITW